MAATISRQLDACNLSDMPASEASVDSHGTMPWKEAKGTMVLGILSLVCLLTTSVWGRVSQTKKLYVVFDGIVVCFSCFLFFFD